MIGTVEEEWSFWIPKFVLKDANGNKLMRIVGPTCCTCSCTGDVEFEVSDMSGRQIGKISKQWTGLAREAFSDTDNFGVNFPLDMPVKHKAILMGAVFLIDFMYYESGSD